MKKIKKSYQNSLFFITILFFLLGIVNISLAVLGLICFTIPLVQYAIYKHKIWCKYYCPRAGLFNRLLSKISLKKKLPKFMTGKRIKRCSNILWSKLILCNNVNYHGIYW